jgi:hypothetical protein
MTEYGAAFKANMVKKMLMPGGMTATALSARRQESLNQRSRGG